MTPGQRRTPRLEEVWPAPLGLARIVLIARPALWINTVGVAVTGLWLAGELWTGDVWWPALLAYFTLPYNLLIYGLNDLADFAEDAVNPRKGGLQGARVREEERAPLLGWIAVLNLPFLALLGLLLPLKAFVVLLLACALFAAYSVPPLRLKARAFLDGLSNVAYALPLALPALARGDTPSLLALGGLMCYSVGKHTFDAVQDIEQDRQAGLTTTATTLGARGAALYAGGWFLLAGLLLWPLSALSALAVLVVAGGLSLRLLRRPTPEQGLRLYPASIVSPWVIGAVSGVQLVYHLARAL